MHIWLWLYDLHIYLFLFKTLDQHEGTKCRCDRSPGQQQSFPLHDDGVRNVGWFLWENCFLFIFCLLIPKAINSPLSATFDFFVDLFHYHRFFYSNNLFMANLNFFSLQMCPTLTPFFFAKFKFPFIMLLFLFIIYYCTCLYYEWKSKKMKIGKGRGRLKSYLWLLPFPIFFDHANYISLANCNGMPMNGGADSSGPAGAGQSAESVQRQKGSNVENIFRFLKYLTFSV